MASFDKIPKGTILLHSRKTFPKWYIQLQFHCMMRQIWDEVRPDAPFSPNKTEKNPLELAKAAPTLDEFLQQKIEQAQEAYVLEKQSWDALPESDRGSEPTAPGKIGAADVKEEYEQSLKQSAVEATRTGAISSRHLAVLDWIKDTVDENLLGIAQIQLVSDNKVSLRKLIAALKRYLGPSEGSTIATIASEYRQVLESARFERQDPLKWHVNWMEAYLRAKEYGVPDVLGPLAARDFLAAVGHRMMPDWSGRALSEYIRDEELGRAPLNVEQLGIWFSAEAGELGNKKKSGTAVYSTLESTYTPSTGHKCPCRRPNQALHKWAPEECYTLEYAVSGVTPAANRATQIHFRAPKPSECERIRARLQHSEFTELRKQLSAKGWFRKSTGNGGQGASASSHNKFPGSISAFFRITGAPEIPGIYSTTQSVPHQLPKSTLVDHCGAAHLVNTVDLLEPGSFQKSEQAEWVEAGTTSFPILGRGTRVLRNALNGDRGVKTEHLTLKDVVVVEGFHVNIVSEARLKQAGIWLLGLDSSLRFGTLEKNVILAQLERHHNLIFIGYKPLSTYSGVPSSNAGILLLPVTIPKYSKLRYSRTQKQEREDSEHLWHLRSGHLGPDALKALVFRARGVLINGTRRIRCSDCATAHARQVISRRASEHVSKRPFWRISWDLFDFPDGLDRKSWVLILKDEFSGKLFVYTLESKRKEQVTEVIQGFESWARNRYGVTICKIRQDTKKQ